MISFIWINQEIKTMKFSLTLITAGFLFIILGCKTSNGAGPSSSETPETPETTLQLPDTLVHSFPVNYSLVLDASSDASKVEIGSYKEVLDLFEKLNYTPESWQAGIREFPRVYLTTIGERWGSSTTKEITVLNKKQLFFRGIAPLILRSNELIKKDRDRLELIRTSFQNTNSLSKADQTWILKLSVLYKVKVPDNHVTAAELEELWKKVDIIPPSLALAQGAEESGWGTSRFALAGNAIYGQWTWGKDAIVPEEQRKELGNYGIASFEYWQRAYSGILSGVRFMLNP
jgi:Bax protein